MSTMIVFGAGAAFFGGGVFQDGGIIFCKKCQNGMGESVAFLSQFERLKVFRFFKSRLERREKVIFHLKLGEWMVVLGQVFSKVA